MRRPPAPGPWCCSRPRWPGPAGWAARGSWCGVLRRSSSSRRLSLPVRGPRACRPCRSRPASGWCWHSWRSRPARSSRPVRCRSATWRVSHTPPSAAAAALALALRAAESGWTRPVVLLGAGGALVAVGMGLAALPNATPLVPAVAAAAVQVAAAGVALRSLGLQMASPALACSAWLIFASSSERPPQWYTLGIGLALLAVVAVWRRDRRLRQLARTPGPGLELAGVAFLVGTPMVQAVTDSPIFALEAGVVGILVALWGVVTRVRRRVATGALVVLVAVVLLVAVPLVQLLPAWGG